MKNVGETSKETSSSMPRVKKWVVAADEGDNDKVGVVWNDTWKRMEINFS